MRFVANSITEHYEHIGELRGELRGEKRGELRAKIAECKEQLLQYESLLAEGALSKQVFTRLAHPLKAKVAAAEVELQALSQEQQAQSA